VPEGSRWRDAAAWLALALGGIALALSIFPLDFLLPLSGSAHPPQGDAAQHMVVQRYFIRDAWRWPLLVAANLNAPDGLNIAFADGIPLLALLLKAIAPVLPPGFQGIGLWYGIAFAAQPLAAAWALRGTGERRWLPAFAVALLACGMPAWLARYGHAALTGHFLILVGLGFYLRLVRRPRDLALWAAAVLAQVLTLLVHPYLAVMTLALLAAVPATLLLRRDGAWVLATAGVAAGTAAVAGTMAVLGYLGAKGEAGYGQYALNLLSPLWPAQSWLLGGLAGGFVDATGFGGWEGYNWLGLGLLAGLAVLAAARPRLLGEVLRRHAGLALALLALTLIAVTHRVGLGGTMLLDLGAVPGFLEQFRASGRFFWPVGLALAVGVVALLARGFAGRAGVALALGLGLLQFADAAALRDELRRLVRQEAPWAVDAAALRPLLAESRQLTLLPSWFCSPAATRAERDEEQHRLLHLLALASERAVPVNTMYVARWKEPPRCHDAELAAAPLGPGELRIILPTARARDLPRVPDAARACRELGELLVCATPR
jgi:hypothetical protein